MIRKNMEDMKQTAEKVIAERGYDYDVDICLTDTDFPVKRMVRIHFRREIMRRLRS